MHTQPIRVMIIDDSAVVRQVMTQTLSKHHDIDVIGVAADPLFAMQKMEKQWPDVIVLDVEMPRMDGITFLKNLMLERPTPVVICSTLTERGAETTLQALAAGAVSVIAKPKLNQKQYLQDSSEDLATLVKGAARARVRSNRSAPVSCAPVVKKSAPENVSHSVASLSRTTDRVIAIGTSTGGTQALEYVLTALPDDAPRIVVVQHMPEKFTAAFAARLDALCRINVREARSGDRVLPGCALIAPGGRHMTLKRNGAQYQVDILDGPPVSRHRPSVDVLFRSVARIAGKNAVGIIMTGMGDDGAKGLLEMHECGAPTLAQDEESCVVYGMPKEAVKLGAVSKIIPLDAIAGAIAKHSDN